MVVPTKIAATSPGPVLVIWELALVDEFEELAGLEAVEESFDEAAGGVELGRAPLALLPGELAGAAWEVVGAGTSTEVLWALW